MTVAALLNRRGAVDIASFNLLAPLPETADELKRVAASLGGKPDDLFLGARASKPVLRKVDWQRYRILSFATHGLMAGELSGVVEPALVLTPPKAISGDDNGLLSASEVAAMKLDSDLVLLSACNTAAADGQPQAEGLSGLARAFFSAGARNLIVSHWSVQSDSTVQLMTRVASAGSGAGPKTWAEALKAAMIDLIEKEGNGEFAHPVHWAPFVAVGAGQR